MKRWLLWNLYCLRGRRCADVEVRPIDTLPPGVVPHVEYVCGGCGTLYHWDARTFSRRRAEDAER